MTTCDIYPLAFMRGGQLFQIARAYGDTEEGFIGLRNGRVLARAPNASHVAKVLIGGSERINAYQEAVPMRR